MPFADLSPHLPGCRCCRPETASRDPIRVSVSYFWVAPAWFFHRNWCLEVIRSVCSSLSTLWRLIFLTPILFDKHPEFGIYLFPSRDKEDKNVTRESPLQSFLPTLHRLRHPLLGLVFLSLVLWNFHDPFSLSSMRSLTSATHLHEP